MLKIELDGANAGSATGLNLAGNNITVQGLVINRFAAPGIDVQGNSDTIQGSFLGTDVTGTLALGNGGADIRVYFVANRVVIGGTTPSARNIVSGALNNYPVDPANGGGYGIFLFADPGHSGVVQGNFIGTDVTGARPLGNASAGIGLDAGGELVAANVISGNNGWGIHGAGADVFQGNFIGTDVTGTKALGNSTDGIFMFQGGSDTIGGVGTGTGNLISGNGGSGIRVIGDTNVISGNFMSTDVTGTSALVNNGVDVLFSGGNNSIIGGLDTNTAGAPLAGGGNLMGPGISLSGSGNVVEGNYMGTDITGTKAIGSSGSGGVFLGQGTTSNTIGGTTTAARNIIVGNGFGIDLDDLGSTSSVHSNVIEGNYIGTDATGTQVLGHLVNGILVLGASGNTIGGTGAGAGNVIAGSTGAGISLSVSNSGLVPSGNRIEGNRIGTDYTGTKAVDSSGRKFGNGNDGIEILPGVNNTIGGTTAGAGNLIANNGYLGGGGGVAVGGTGNLVQGNSIIGNTFPGVVVNGVNNTVGGLAAGAANTIAYNSGDGVFVYGGTGNSILSNSIHDNSGLGIHLNSGANDNQAAPMLTSAASSSSGTTISGSLTNTPGATFRIEFFTNQAPDPSGYEGQTLLGAVNVTTDATTGYASFTAALPALPAGYTVLSATATKLVGTNLTPNDTSQFSNDVSIPVVGAITAPLAPVAVNTAVNVSASFTDAIPSTPYAALWSWGDNTTSGGSVTQSNGSGTVTGSHTYAVDGVYTVTLTVTNAGGGSGQSVFQYVVVFNPSAGFVTGGGWITSPAGAYAANPNLTGRANFGFNAKYHKGDTVPTGDVEFQFPAANLNFHSTGFDWLVVNGNVAQFQGSGTINGAGNYGFLVTAYDGGQGQSKLRIKIWDKNNGNAVVFDTQMGDAETALPTTLLGGGNIQVHSS